MKKILLTLSSFIFHIYSADFVSVHINIEKTPPKPEYYTIDMKPTATIKDVLKKFARLHTAGDIEIKGSVVSFGIPPGILNPDQTVLAAGLDKSYNYILIENPLIDITCRTLTGITFTVQMNLFEGFYGYDWIATPIKKYLQYQVAKGIEDARLQEIYKKLFYALDHDHCKLIHGRKELRYASKPFRVEGLLADPNITIIIEPRRR